MTEYLILLCLVLALLLCVVRSLLRMMPAAEKSLPAEDERLCRRLAAGTVTEISRLCPPGIALRCTPTVENGHFSLNFELKNGSGETCCRDGMRLLLTADLLDRRGIVIESVGIDIEEELPPDAYVADMVSLDRGKLAEADRLCVRVLTLTDSLDAA